MAILLAARRSDPVRIEGVSDPADPDRDLYETGALLPGPDATLAGPTFEEWLGSTPENRSRSGLAPSSKSDRLQAAPRSLKRANSGDPG